MFLPPFCWYEICKFLTPPDLFRLSQSNSTLYHHMFSMKNSDFSWSLELLETHLMKLETCFSTKRGKLILDQLNSNNEKIAKLFCGSIHENRNMLKRCLAVYLKFKYGNELDSDFLIYLPVNCLGQSEKVWPIELVPFKNIIRKVESQWKGSESESNNNLVLLVHGYVDFDGNITIFNIEIIDKLPPAIYVYKELKRIDIETRFRKGNDSSIGFLTKFIENLEKSDLSMKNNNSSMVAYQEFIIPNRKLKIVSSQSYWTITMNPFNCKFRVSYDELVNSFKFAVHKDIKYLILFSMYAYFNVKSVGFCQFRSTTNLLKLPFSYNMNIVLKGIMSLGLMGCQYFLSFIFMQYIMKMLAMTDQSPRIVFVVNALCYLTGMDWGKSKWMNLLAPIEICHNIIFLLAGYDKCNIVRLVHWIKHASITSYNSIFKKCKNSIKNLLFKINNICE